MNSPHERLPTAPPESEGDETIESLLEENKVLGKKRAYASGGRFYTALTGDKAGYGKWYEESLGALREAQSTVDKLKDMDERFKSVTIQASPIEREILSPRDEFTDKELSPSSTMIRERRMLEEDPQRPAFLSVAGGGHYQDALVSTPGGLINRMRKVFKSFKNFSKPENMEHIARGFAEASLQEHDAENAAKAVALAERIDGKHPAVETLRSFDSLSTDEKGVYRETYEKYLSEDIQD